MTINWGDTHIELGFEASVIFIVLLIIIILVVCIGVAKSIAKGKWVCPKCHTVFTVTWKQAYPGFHYGESHLLKCPKCKKRYYCSESHEL